MGKHNWLTGLFIVFFVSVQAQTAYELNTGWKCQAIGKVKVGGDRVSRAGFSMEGWLEATVPGTVLTTLINNRLEPDPFYGLNNQQIPDIYATGRDRYTYWFVRDFKEPAPGGGGQVWLNLRGVNYGCDVWLNGHKLNAKTHYGMFLRQTYNITRWLNSGGGMNSGGGAGVPARSGGESQRRPGWRWRNCAQCNASICSRLGLDTVYP
jgi:mannosylglycoprotein endo-beta-mannosidase